ncbi:ABC transporter ATP-binding protein [Planktotalea sp.]|uniref:ABC transporter ATP-binding protein n=1 Tax=Planktotalea sp. TaxID=2029877 RepID=UPI0032969D4E
MATIEIKNLTKSFGAAKVLHDLNLQVEEGEFVALVGPSGCGKSTLLRILAGLEEPTSGDILMDGAEVNDLNPKERNIAMVFQSYALYPHMTAGQNIGFNLRISGMKKAQIAEEVNKAADILDLKPLLDRKPSQLSGGQRQRVAMGRALVRNPAAFLFDEPLSNLDAKLRVQMRDEIKTLHTKVKTTSIYVTHDQIEAMTLADRIVIMKDGRIQQVGSPSELYTNPANRFVAGFIGSPAMNFLPAELTASGALKLSETAQIMLPAIPMDVVAGKVDAGIRPEHFTIDPTGTAPIKGEVISIEPTGAQNLIRVRIGAGVATVIDNALLPITAGEPVALNVALEKIKVYPPEES